MGNRNKQNQKPENNVQGQQNQKPEKPKKVSKDVYVVVLEKQYENTKPGIYAGYDTKAKNHVFLTNGIEDKKRNLYATWTDDKEASEKRCEAINRLLPGLKLGIKKIKIEE